MEDVMLEDATVKRLDKGFTIKYPSTTHDDGSPSGDILNDCQRILRFIEDERHLAAQKLHTSITERLNEHPGKNRPNSTNLFKRKKLKKIADAQKEEYDAISQFLEARRDTFETLEVRAFSVFESKVSLLTTDWNHVLCTLMEILQ